MDAFRKLNVIISPSDSLADTSPGRHIFVKINQFWNLKLWPDIDVILTFAKMSLDNSINIAMKVYGLDSVKIYLLYMTQM